MILPIIDDRAGEEVFLSSIDDGHFFTWNEYLMRKLHGNEKSNIFHAECEVACEVMGNGEVISLKPDAMVVPIWCELHIVEG